MADIELTRLEEETNQLLRRATELIAASDRLAATVPALADALIAFVEQHGEGGTPCQCPLCRDARIALAKMCNVLGIGDISDIDR